MAKQKWDNISKQLVDITTPTPEPMRNKNGPLTDQQRAVAKIKFLEAMAKTDIKTAACESAGITWMTYKAWMREGFITTEELDHAKQRYDDQLRGEILKRGFIGEDKPLVVNGRIVYDRAGNQVNLKIKDSRILIELAKRHLDEWKVAEKMDITMRNATFTDIPQEYQLVLDIRELDDDDWEVIDQVAKRVQARKDLRDNIIEGSVG